MDPIGYIKYGKVVTSNENIAKHILPKARYHVHKKKVSEKSEGFFGPYHYKEISESDLTGDEIIKMLGSGNNTLRQTKDGKITLISKQRKSEMSSFIYPEQFNYREEIIATGCFIDVSK